MRQFVFNTRNITQLHRQISKFDILAEDSKAEVEQGGVQAINSHFVINVGATSFDQKPDHFGLLSFHGNRQSRTFDPFFELQDFFNTGSKVMDQELDRTLETISCKLQG
jgi:hypothetical protein